MAKRRSTRDRILWQAGQIARKLDEATEHLYAIDVKADGRSDWIQLQVPLLYEAFSQLRDIVQRFRDGL
jgi:hypothetical protein